jgi:hypothetical protein
LASFLIKALLDLAFLTCLPASLLCRFINARFDLEPFRFFFLTPGLAVVTGSGSGTAEAEFDAEFNELLVRFFDPSFEDFAQGASANSLPNCAPNRVLSLHPPHLKSPSGVSRGSLPQLQRVVPPVLHDRATEWVTAAAARAYTNACSLVPEI